MADKTNSSISPEVGESEELLLLRSLLEASDYGVLFSRLDRRDVFCNKRFSQIFGVDGSQTVQKSPDQVRAMVLPYLKDPDGFAALLDAIYADPHLIREDEIELLSPRTCLLRRYTSPVVDSKGAIIGRIWTFLDISRTRSLEKRVEAQAAELKLRAAELTAALKSTSGRLLRTESVLARAQRTLLESEKLTAAGLLAASVTHDIDNVLTPLLIEMSLVDTDDTCQRKEALDSMREQIKMLSLLARRLLSFARPDERREKPVDLKVVIDRVAGLLRPSASMEQVEIRIRVSRRLPPVRGDEGQIEQMLVNLALNGIQAMSRRQPGVLTIAASGRSGRALLSISDTGPGIAPEMRRRLFDPFQTSRPGGTGLGLYSCRRIAEAHSSSLRVRSIPGKGARFTVSLPLCCIESEEAARLENHGAPGG